MLRENWIENNSSRLYLQLRIIRAIKSEMTYGICREYLEIHFPSACENKINSFNKRIIYHNCII